MVVDEQTETEGVDYSVSEDVMSHQLCSKAGDSQPNLILISEPSADHSSFKTIGQRVVGGESKISNNHFRSSQLKLSFEPGEKQYGERSDSESLLSNERPARRH